MKFQEDQFSFPTISHNENPSSLETKPKSLIIAVSVFTHLPLQSCIDWIKKLTECLEPKGKLIFTFNDISKCPFLNDGNFHFEEQSEDSPMSGIPDRLDNVKQYGSTYFSVEKMNSIVGQYGSDFQIKSQFIGTHSAVIFTK